jgi:hypothetical protein
MKVVDSVTVTLSLNAELPIKSSVDEQRDSVQLVDIASANEVVADEKVKTVDNQVETANKKVKTAEEMVATANKDVATAKEELAAAKRKVETAEDDKKEAAEKNLLKAEKNLAKVVWDLAEAKRVFAMAMRDLVALDPKAGGTTNWNYEVERTTSVAISLQTAYDNLVNPPATSTSSVVATIESAEAHRRAGVVPSHHMQDFMRAVADGKVEIISAQLPSIVPAGSDDPGKSLPLVPTMINHSCSIMTAHICSSHHRMSVCINTFSHQVMFLKTIVYLAAPVQARRVLSTILYIEGSVRMPPLSSTTSIARYPRQLPPLHLHLRQSIFLRVSKKNLDNRFGLFQTLSLLNLFILAPLTSSSLALTKPVLVRQFHPGMLCQCLPSRSLLCST